MVPPHPGSRRDSSFKLLPGTYFIYVNMAPGITYQSVSSERSALSYMLLITTRDTLDTAMNDARRPCSAMGQALPPRNRY